MSEQLSSSVISSPYSPMRVSPPLTVLQPSPAWVNLALGHLSPREREVLTLLSMRWTDREIADSLCISYRTVTTHVSNIFDKLGVNSRREAAALAAHAHHGQQ